MRHHPFSRRGFGGPAFERGGGRVFEQGDLRWVVLGLIAERPRHGYELIKEIEDRLGGGYSPSPGVIYPTLTLLEELGYVAAASADGARKLFEITPEGRAQLAANQASVDGLFQKMSRIRERSAGGYSPPVQRGIENLFTALRLKLGQGPLSEAESRAVAEALDAAAVAIERA